MTFADVINGAHVANLAFHKNAFALASRPLTLPMGNENAYVASLPNGLSVRVVMGYDITTKKDTISMDILYGVNPIFPELATRILG